MSIFFVVLVTLRPIEVPDTENYKNIFEVVKVNRNYGFNLYGKEYTTGVEYGFLYLMQICKKYITSNYRIFFLVVAVIEILLFIVLSKKCYKSDLKKGLYFLFFLMPYFGWMYSCIVIRVAIAMLLALIAFNSDIKRQLILKILVYILAICFHRTSIIVILCELIFRYMPILNKKVYRIIWLISGLLNFINLGAVYDVIINFLNEIISRIPFFTYQHYIDNVSVSNNGISLRCMFFWSIGFLMLRYYDDIRSDIFKKWFNIYIIGLVVMGLISFISGASRVYDYFMISIPFLLTEMFSSDRRLMKKSYYWGFSIVYSVLCVTVILRL